MLRYSSPIAEACHVNCIQQQLFLICLHSMRGGLAMSTDFSMSIGLGMSVALPTSMDLSMGLGLGLSVGLGMSTDSSMSLGLGLSLALAMSTRFSMSLGLGMSKCLNLSAGRFRPEQSDLGREHYCIYSIT